MAERKIRLLDDRTINQIAAGEVIENAASVVKELIENSLDAKATYITIETKPNFIRIIDNGQGIDKQDLPLALARHATSKIQSIQDLDLLKSLGFRGEALASIASVSKLSILTAADDSGLGCYIEGWGKEQKITVRARQRGTTVEVNSLFYNVPVRRKFLKSERTETASILKVLTAHALGNPSIGFCWIHEDKVQFEFEAGDFLLERIKTLLGEEVANSLFPVELDDTICSLLGFCSRPTYHRPNKSGQFLYINGRPIVSSFISLKVLEGYATRLPSHRFPFFVLNLNVESDWVDVNVHPQKKEVRFQHEEKLGRFLIRAIEESLQHKEKPAPVVANFSSLLKEKAPFFPEMEVETVEKRQTDAERTLSFASGFQILAKIGYFVFVEKEGSFLIVDLKRARSRITYDKLRRRTTTYSQQLLIPLTLEFSEVEKLKLLDSLDRLNQMGFGVRFFGNKTFIVDCIPSYLAEGEIRELLLAFLDGGKNHEERSMAAVIERSTFLLEEARLIVEMLFQCDSPDTTDDGKKICILLTEKELENRFNE